MSSEAKPTLEMNEPPSEDQESENLEETTCCCCVLTSCDDGFDEWKQEASINGEECKGDDDDQSWSFTVSTKPSFETSTKSGFSRSRRHSRKSKLRGVYRPRSGLSARVRFILPVESYLSGEFDLLPPVQESPNNASTASTWNPVTSIFATKEPAPVVVEEPEATGPSSILKMNAASRRPKETLETWMNVEQEQQEANQEYNGMILIVAPRGVELHKPAGPVKREKDLNYFSDDDEDDSLDGDESLDVPRDVAVFLRSSGDEVSLMNDDYINYAGIIAQEEASARKHHHSSVSPRVSILKRIKSMRENRRAYKVIARHGKELYAV